MTIKVVEDNAINQKVMSQQLRKAGCAAVHVMDHGLDALSFLATTSFQVSSSSPSTAAAPPVPLSVILLDVEMPVMDGLTCARAIRDMQAEGSVRNHVPIIGITANARMEQVSSCIEAGMDEVIVSLHGPCSAILLFSTLKIFHHINAQHESMLFRSANAC